jgi:aryl-alcohol dehydrogenase-like predicted oxidoreductase
MWGRWAEEDVAAMVRALQALASLRADGLVRHVGVADPTPAAVAAIFEAGVPLATVQTQLSLLDRRSVAGGEGALLAVCKAHAVPVVAYNTLVGGFLSDDWLHQPEPQVRTDIQ